MIERDARGFRRPRLRPGKNLPYWGLVPSDLADVTIAALPPEAPITPERRLLAAVLGEAILDLEGRDMIAHHGAREWVISGTSGVQPFDALCEGLGFEPDAWRERMLAIRPGAGGLRSAKFRGARTLAAYRSPPKPVRTKARKAAWAKLGA